jgi:hypothetical protein
MGSSPGPLAAPLPPQKSWFAAHWKAVLGLGCLGLIVLAVTFAAGIFFLVETSIKHTAVYTEALSRARANPLLVEKIGERMEAGWLISGSISTSGPSGSADFSFPISGPKGNGTLYVVAKKSAGRWQFETLQAEIAGDSRRIDLLQPEPAEQ